MRAVTIDSDLATLFTFTPRKPPITPIQEVQAVFGINFLRFDARSRLCAPRLGTGFAATVSRTPSPRMVEGPINSFHRQVARRPRNAETTESTADEP